MLEQIQQEVKNDLFYQQNFANDGERFVAWYPRRVLLLRDPIDEDSRIVIIQGNSSRARRARRP